MLRKSFVIQSAAILLPTFLVFSACSDSDSTVDNNTTSSVQTDPADNSAPTLSLKGEQSVTVQLGTAYTDAGAVATDPEDGEIAVSVSSDLNTSRLGEYTITYTATDSAGKSVSLTRTVVVDYNTSILPLDTNTVFDKEKKYIYFANPKAEEGGHNSVVRIDYKNMKLDKEIRTLGINPHSIDRAGDTKKFYVRTQDSNSFDIVNFDEGTIRSQTIAFPGFTLTDTNPRSIGAYNAKYNLQLLAGKHRPIIAIIDVATDEIVGVAGDDSVYDPAVTYSGHGVWFNENYFGIVSRNENDEGNSVIKMYKVTQEADGSFKVEDTYQAMTFSTKLHAIERVLDPQTADDLTTFYALGESKLPGFPPNVTEIKFDPDTGVLTRAQDATVLVDSNVSIGAIAPATHHGNITPDKKYYVAPVSDGKVYFIDRKTMQIAKEIRTNLDNLNKGLGAAHIEFSASQKLAMVTNHFSNYLTVIDMSSPDVKDYTIMAQIKIGEVAFDPNEPHLMQPHFALVGEDGRYFYTAASHEGIFIRVDLEKLKTVDPADYSDYNKLKSLGVLETILIGGVIEQSHS